MARKEYSVHSLQVLTPEEHIRKRPGMYVGSLGYEGITVLLMKYCSSVHHEFGAEEMKITLRDEHISIEVNAHVPEAFFEVHRWQNAIFEDRFYVPPIKILASSFNLKHQGKSKTTLQFIPDPEIWKESQIPLDYLNAQFYEFAICRKKARVTLIDEREAVPQQLYHHYPSGLLAVAKRCYRGNQPEEDIFYLEGSIGEHRYKIALVLKNGSFPQNDPFLIFASKNKATEAGSMVNGISLGMKDALRSWEASNMTENGRFSKKQLLSQCCLIAQVDVPVPIFAGCTKNKLDMPIVRKEVRLLIKKEFLAFLQTHHKLAEVLHKVCFL
jgi:DNA gyrase/topoisomerase IV subunit B